MADIYFKATRKGGVSFHDRAFVYHLGQNVHPKPDREDDGACGRGIHLAKTLNDARAFAANEGGNVEYYTAEAGVILGEDSYKVRCASCVILKQLTPADLQTEDKKQKERLQREEAERKRLQEERAKEEKEREWLRLFGLTYEPLCGREWLTQHARDVTPAIFAAQGIELYVDDTRRLELKANPKLTAKNIREAIRTKVG